MSSSSPSFPKDRTDVSDSVADDDVGIVTTGIRGAIDIDETTPDVTVKKTTYLTQYECYHSTPKKSPRKKKYVVNEQHDTSSDSRHNLIKVGHKSESNIFEGGSTSSRFGDDGIDRSSDSIDISACSTLKISDKHRVLKSSPKINKKQKCSACPCFFTKTREDAKTRFSSNDELSSSYNYNSALENPSEHSLTKKKSHGSLLCPCFSSPSKNRLSPSGEETADTILEGDLGDVRMESPADRASQKRKIEVNVQNPTGDSEKEGKPPKHNLMECFKRQKSTEKYYVKNIEQFSNENSDTTIKPIIGGIDVELKSTN